MNETLHSFIWLFWFSLLTSAIFASFTCLLIWRRDLWVRFLDGEQAFWKRFGLPWKSFDRRFGASRFFTIIFVFFSLVMLFLTLACAVWYFYLKHRLERG
jgi:hypothetical protein